MYSFLSSRLKLTLAIFLFIFCSYQSIAQTTSVVTNNLNTGPGSLRNAIAEANADALSTPDKPHKITFAATVADTITISTPFLVVTNHVNIVGPGKDKLVISGGHTTRIFWLQNGNISISGLTLARGYSRGGNGGYAGGGGMGAGGAIFMHEGRQDPQSANGIIAGSLIVRIINVDFKNNFAWGGSGGHGYYHVDFEEGGARTLVGGGGGMGGSGGGQSDDENVTPGGAGGVIGNGGHYFGGSVTGANDLQPGTNGGIMIFGSGSGGMLPGFGGGGLGIWNAGSSETVSKQNGNFGGGGGGSYNYAGKGGFGGGGGGAQYRAGDGGFGGGGGGGASWAGNGGFGASDGKPSRQEGEKGWDSGEGGTGLGAGGAIFVTSGKLILSGISFIANSAILGGAVFIFNKQDNNGQQAPGTSHDPVVTSCGKVIFSANMAPSGANQPGINDDNQYGTISEEEVEIVDKPHGQTVDAGSNVTASVTTSGSVVSYQWYKDGVSLGASQRTATLTLSNVTQADAGRYKIVVKGICKTRDCSCFVLKVRPTMGAKELKLQVTPSPSSTYFTIIATSNNLNEKVVLKITDVTGRVIEERNTTVSNINQVGSSYRPGIYIVQAIQGDKAATFKIIKQ